MFLVSFAALLHSKKYCVRGGLKDKIKVTVYTIYHFAVMYLQYDLKANFSTTLLRANERKTILLFAME